jgi:hypothetical protein
MRNRPISYLAHLFLQFLSLFLCLFLLTLLLLYFCKFNLNFSDIFLYILCTALHLLKSSLDLLLKMLRNFILDLLL